MRGLAALAAAVLLSLTALIATAPIALHLSGKGVVVGGLMPCDALGQSPLHYAAGSIGVLRDGDTVAAEQVDDNEMFLFLLDPGSYVVNGRYASGAIPEPRVQLTVAAGSIIETDLPDECI
jgi:hypothetical protein